jgi:hypothetical protein
VALREATQVIGVNIFNAPFVNNARRDVAGCNEVAQGLGRELVDFVVVVGHAPGLQKRQSPPGLGRAG